MRGSLLVAVVMLVASMAHAAPTVVPTASTLLFQPLAVGAGLPVFLTPGTQGATTVNAHQTGADSTVTGTVVGASFNITRIESGVPNGVLVRLVATSATGALSECASCTVDLRVAATTLRQITITNGVMTQSSGDWLQINANGTGGSMAWIWVRAQTTVFANNAMDLAYVLEVKSAEASSAKASYSNLTTTFVV